jgi:hypothetical protein
VSLLRKTHLKQTQSQPLNKNELDDSELIIEDGVTFGRNLRSRDFGKIVQDKYELSDYVKLRLWLARQLALRSYEKAQS